MYRLRRLLDYPIPRLLVSFHPVIRMNARAPAILDHLASLADTTRSRHAAAARSPRADGVASSAPSMQLPQSTVSRHLKALADAGWVVGARRRHEPPLHDGARRARRRRRGGCGCSCASRSAPTAGGGAGSAPAAGARSPSGAPSRRSSSRRRPASGTACATSCSASGSTWPRWRRWPAADWVVGDLGCGTGQVSAALAPFVARVIAVDASAAMLQAARKRLHGARQRRAPARRARGAADRRRRGSMPRR